MKTTFNFALSLITFTFLTSCANKGGIETSPSGLKYQIHTKMEGNKPAIGDVLTLNLLYKTDKDSVLFDSFSRNKPVKTILGQPSFKGGVEEGFAMLSKGDSATFIVSADSLFEKTFGGKMPPFVKAGSLITFIVKLEDFQTQKEIDDAKKAVADKNKGSETELLTSYLSKNNITQKPTASGLYYVETLAGKGAMAEKGKTVFISYTGKLLDGTIFDSNINSGKPIEFELGGHHVIDGWEEGILMMKKGGKAMMVIPSNLAYGEKGAQNPQTGDYIIPPYSPIMFDVELVDVK